MSCRRARDPSDLRLVHRIICDRRMHEALSVTQSYFRFARKEAGQNVKFKQPIHQSVPNLRNRMPCEATTGKPSHPFMADANAPYSRVIVCGSCLLRALSRPGGFTGDKSVSSWHHGKEDHVRLHKLPAYWKLLFGYMQETCNLRRSTKQIQKERSIQLLG